MAQMMPTIAAGTAKARTAKTSTDSNQLIVVGETITVTGAQLTLGALFGNVRLPKGAEVAWVMLDSTDIDSATSVTLEIGDAGDTDRLLAANTIGQTGAAVVGPTIAKTGFGYKYTDETLVQVRVAAAPGTPVAGTIKYLIGYVSQ